jgi:hypothetical protein
VANQCRVIVSVFFFSIDVSNVIFELACINNMKEFHCDNSMYACSIVFSHTHTHNFILAYQVMNFGPSAN